MYIPVLSPCQVDAEGRVLFQALRRNVRCFQLSTRTSSVWMRNSHVTSSVVYILGDEHNIRSGGSGGRKEEEEEEEERPVCHSVLLLVSCFPAVYYADI